MTLVKNLWNVRVDFEVAKNFMDEEIVENISEEFSPITKQEFFNKYCEAHKLKFDEEWEFAKKNPVY